MTRSFVSNNRDVKTKDSKGDSAFRVVAEVTSIPLINSNIDFDVADGNVSAIKAIYKTVNGVKPAFYNQTESESIVIGLSINGAIDGDVIRYKTHGRMEDSSFAFAINVPLYLGINGALTESEPVTGYRTQVATSLEVGAININIQEPIEL